MRTEKRTEPPRARAARRVPRVSRFFAFFFVSGACSLVYQVVWLRRAMADFGVTTPMVSIVLSVFMAGLALGSWVAGRLVRRLDGRPPGTLVRAYAATEVLIAVSGLVVAPAFDLGRALLFVPDRALEWGSAASYAASGAWIALVMLPFCACMGATFPLAMAGIRSAWPALAERSFSYLYLANVAGAAVGLLGSAFAAIELLGFRGTLLLAAALNAALAAAAWATARNLRSDAPSARPTADVSTGTGARFDLAVLFTTGLASLAMEVAWTRMFVPFQGTVVYAFAATLAAYLLATAAGSWFYRRRIARSGDWSDRTVAWLLVAAAFTALLPLLAADPRLGGPMGLANGSLRVLAGVGPFCAVLGLLAPLVVDRYSRGDPRRAGVAYAWNALGCVVGPLVAGFALLPTLGERYTVVILTAPLWALGAQRLLRAGPPKRAVRAPASAVPRLAMAGIASVALVALTRNWEALLGDVIVRRDHTATVIAAQNAGGKHLIVNGVSMTILTPITKMMAHLPLAFLDRPAERGLVLCFGMGTSFRSLRSWGIPTTAVELVPSVPELFRFYHSDAAEIMRSPDARIVIDDARRFLERAGETYDVIVVDPPPPIEAAGSSLLYSREFCQIAARRLRPGGILQHWVPEGDPVVFSAATRALTETFPYVRVFGSLEGWGVHFLASNAPIPQRSGYELSVRLPPAAAADLIEWGPAASTREQFEIVVAREQPVAQLIGLAPHARALTDDRPVNEYWMLRRALGSRP